MWGGEDGENRAEERVANDDARCRAAIASGRVGPWRAEGAVRYVCGAGKGVGRAREAVDTLGLLGFVLPRPW